MSDLKFNCSNCGQHLSGDAHYAGLAITCPTCGQQVVVPSAAPPVGLAVARGAPPRASAQTLPRPRPPQKTCGLAIASLICSVGSFVIIPFGFIPGIICGHMAKKKIATTPGLQGRGMAKAGLIVGYIALGLNVLVVLAVAAFFAFFATRIQQVSQGARPQFPPSTVRMPPRIAPPPGAETRVAPPPEAEIRVAPPPEAETTDTEPDGSGWTMKLAGVMFPSGVVTGRIHGQPFKLEKVSLEGGWLKFAEGKGFFADREIDVVLFVNDTGKLSGRTFTVPKQEFGGNPHIWMKWKDAGESMLKQSTYMDRYALRLEFGAPAGGKLPGKIYLCLPDKEKSFVAGTFQVPLRGAR